MCRAPNWPSLPYLVLLAPARCFRRFPQLEDALDTLTARYEKVELELQRSQAREKALSEAMDTIARASNPSALRDRERQKYEEMRKHKSRSKPATHHSGGSSSSGHSSGTDGVSGLLGRPRAAAHMSFDQAESHHSSSFSRHPTSSSPMSSFGNSPAQPSQGSAVRLGGQPSMPLPSPPKSPAAGKFSL